MVPVLEAVPNFSEGRDPALIRRLVEVIARDGAEVLDWSADRDHHRSVITFIGEPSAVENASVSAARFAFEHIDLRGHQGVHPRIGALDVLPFVPLQGLTMEDAVRSAHRVGRRIAELGVPVYFYGEASDPPGRTLAALRAGGFEALREGFPPGREPDLLAGSGPHPSAGAVCVGARRLLLAWNVYVEGVDVDALKGLAARLRESGGGVTGLRALALALPSRGKVQLSMTLENVDEADPLEIFGALEEGLRALGGVVAGTEVIGMVPDALVQEAARTRLELLDYDSSRHLSSRVREHSGNRGRQGAVTSRPPQGNHEC